MIVDFRRLTVLQSTNQFQLWTEAGLSKRDSDRADLRMFPG